MYNYYNELDSSHLNLVVDNAKREKKVFILAESRDLFV